jgi:hypothetical protein
MEIMMAKYDVYVFCNECSDVHPLGIRIDLEDGPTKKESIGDLFAGKELPADIVTLINNKTVCPNTNKLFTQTDNKQVFIVPISNNSNESI